MAEMGEVRRLWRASFILVFTAAVCLQTAYGLYLLVEHWMVLEYGELVLVAPGYIGWELYLWIPLMLLSTAALFGCSLYWFCQECWREEED